MLNDAVTAAIRKLSGPPYFRIFGRASYESDWHVIDIFATHRRDLTSRWPLWGGACITWTANVIAVGWGFAERVYQEQCRDPASKENPVTVAGGRIRDWQMRLAAGASSHPSASEILAHECGHTAQARRLGFLYWPLVGSVTLFREGPHWWNRFENEASATGQFGGIVSGSVAKRLTDTSQGG